MSSLETLRAVKEGDKLTATQVFDCIVTAATLLNNEERESDAALEIGIRLLEADRLHAIPRSCRGAVEHLVEELGLYPYIDPEHFTLLERSIIEAHAVDLEQKRYLHAKQMEVLLSLLAGDNVVLSAPTSFGKSILVDALISKKKPKCVLIILPTIALIDETRRRISANFQSEYNIITTTSVSVRRNVESDESFVILLVGS